MSIANSISYLGMQVSWKDATFTVDMDFYVDQVLKDWKHVAMRSGPGLRDTFKIDEASKLFSKLLAEKPRQLFHSRS